jgi:dTDP-4-amino-4,6-dideoxygalactose transaminase
VFAEINPDTLNIDPADAARRITKRTKAIMPVHLFGRPAAIGDLRTLDVPIVEDAAQAFGSPGIATSIASTFSFFPTKNLFALGDGGLVSANDGELADRIRMLRFHGSRDKKDFDLIGYNSRLDAVQAAMLRVFLPHLAGWNAARREAAARYEELGLGEVAELPVDEPGHVYHMYCVRSFERDRLAAALEDAGIGFASYYQPPLHLQPALRHLGYSEGDLPVTEKAARENLCLPMWGGISEEQQSEVVAVLRRASSLVNA